MTDEASRQRDAWYVFRGYVYQVETTLERWLDLGDEERLELENGEDIDIVSGWAEGGDTEQRLLEQIKHLDRPLTLNSREARAALAHFIESRTTAPAAANIRFRFLTTASIGEERAPAMSDGTRGIDTWLALRSADLDELVTSTRAKALRELLREGAEATAPPGVSADAWEGYRVYVRTLDVPGVIDLVEAFEWSTASPELGELRAHLRARLRTSGRADSDAEADLQHDALFAAAFSELSKRGTKQLTAAARDRVLSAPTEALAAMPAFQRINALFVQLSARLETIGAQAANAAESISRLEARVEAIAGEQGFGVNVVVTAYDADTTPPPLLSVRSNRTDSLVLLERAIGRGAWLAVHGTSGAGKTELVNLFASSRRKSTRWLSGRDLSARDLVHCIRHMFFGSAGPPPGSRPRAYAERARTLTRDTLVVIDDIPRLDGDGELGREISALAVGLQTTDAKLVTTSAFDLSERLASRLSSVACRLPVPSFTEGEIGEVLSSHGSPPCWTSPERIAQLRRVTSGHAELVVTAVAYLRSRSWADTPVEMNALEQNEFTATLQRDVLRRLEATVSLPAAHDLLFRCAVARGPFSTEDAQAVSRVFPALERWGASLSALEGLWLQAAGANAFSVCPAAKPLSSQLSPEVAKGVHRVLADRIVDRPVMGPIGARDAITHYLSADASELALRLFVGVLVHLASPENALRDDGGLLGLWSTSPLPASGVPGLDVLARALQIAALKRRRRRNAFLLSDALALASRVDDDGAWALFSLIPLMPELSSHDFAAATDVVLRVALGPSRFEREGQPVDFTGSAKENFLWHQASYVRSFEEAKIWLSRLGRIPPAQLAELATGPAFEFACMGLCDWLWMAEAKKPDQDRDWSSVLARLAEIKEEGARLGLSLLSVMAERAIATLLADYEKRLADAIDLCDGVLATASDDSTRLLMNELAGRLLVHGGDNVRGAHYLDNALTTTTTAFALTRLMAIRWRSKAELDPGRRVELAEAATAFARKMSPALPPAQIAKVDADLALALHSRSGVASAWRALSDAAADLYANEEAEDGWRDAAVLLAHVSGYMNSVATLNRPPDPIPRGDGTFEPPGDLVPGMFLTYSDNRAARYTGDFAYHTAATLCLLADSYGDDVRAGFWAEQARRRVGGASADARPRQELIDFIRGNDLAVRFGPLVGTRVLAEAPLELVGGTIAVAIAGVLARRYRFPDRDDESAGVHGLLLTRLARDPEDLDLALGVRLLVAAPAPVDALVATSADERYSLFARAAARLVASVHPERRFEAAFSDHLQVAYWCSGMRGPPITTLMRRLVTPFMQAFWISAVNGAGFAFRSPGLLRAGLFETSLDGAPDLDRRILCVVADSLSLNLPNNVRHWLRGRP